MDFRSSRWRAIDMGAKAKSVIDSGQAFAIFGLTNYAKQIAEYANSVGNQNYCFVDDWSNVNEFGFKSVRRSTALEGSTQIFNAVVEGRPRTVQKFLERNGFRFIHSYFHLHAASPEIFKMPFSDFNVSELQAHAYDYLSIGELLKDSQSKIEWQLVLAARYSMDYLQPGLEYRLQDQYWEPEIYDISKKGHFIDGGCYDGNTAREFARRNPNYQKISAFEPILSNMEKVQVNLSGYRDVDLYPLALHKDMAVRTFSENHSASGISISGDIAVPCATLDSIMEGKPVHFLKLDVEGSELVALEGAQNTITQHAPTIAVCVYHDQRHFLEIPKTIWSWVPEYRLYFRHYTEGIFESVLYFEKD